MSFISYSIRFFNERIYLYESKYSLKAPRNILHEAKVLLKFLEDIKDEGYQKSYDFINEKTNAVDRLTSFILKNDGTPFLMEKFTVDPVSEYKVEQYNLDEYLCFLKDQMSIGKHILDPVPTVFYDILNYSRAIFESANSDTAYCFLLRDTLLPYLSFEKWNIDNKLIAHPLFISRKYLSFFDCGNNNFDIYSGIQDIIFDTLDNDITNFSDFKSCIRKRIKSKSEFKELINLLKGIMDSIKQENIMIIESGYIGTIPILLSSIDDRVDFRLFTTIPYFYEVYKGKFFTDEFQKIRLFETIRCQDALFKLASIDRDNVSICETSNTFIKGYALAELCTWNKLISKFNNI